MADESLALVLLQWEESKDADKVSLTHITVTHVLVSDLCQCAHRVLCDLHVFGAESLVTSCDALDKLHRLGKEWLEGLGREGVRKGTHAIGDRVLDKIALSEFLVADSLKELLSDLGNICCIVTNARVVDDVTPEAKYVQELLFGQLSVALQLGSPVGLRAGLNTGQCLVLELLDELAGELHDLRGDTSDLGHLILNLIQVLLVHLVGGLRLLDQSAVSTLQRRNQVESFLDKRSKSVDLLHSEELHVGLVDAAHGA